MRTKLFLLVLVLQSAWMLGTALTQERALRTGQLILLETRPVDPRDLLRGDYVILNYHISDVPKSLLPDRVRLNSAYAGDIFVALAPAGTNQFWEITRAGTDWLPPAADEVVMRGRAGPGWRNRPDSIHVEYGIEKYFVAEGSGNPSGKLTAQVAVTSSGRAHLKQVLVDGKPYAAAVKKAE